MKVFLDANILVAVLNKEYPLYTYSARIMSLAGTPRYKIYTSPVCLAIAFYFAEKKSGSKLAKEKIKLICEHLDITEMGAVTVSKAIADKKVKDFEDGLEFYSAKSSNCEVIVTDDVKDYYFADIEVITPPAFFEKYMKSATKK